MIRDRITRAVADRPRTLEELSEDLGIPQATLRTALTGEFFKQVEFDHPKHGRVTAWTPAASRLRVDEHGRYHSVV